MQKMHIIAISSKQVVLCKDKFQLLNQCSTIIIMIKPSQAINYINFISKITPALKESSPSPFPTSKRKEDVQCLSSLQKRLASINKDQVSQGNRNHNRQLKGQQHSHAQSLAGDASSHEKSGNFSTNSKRNLYEVYRQNLVRKKEFLMQMVADQENKLWQSCLTQSQEQNRQNYQIISCNNSCVNSRTRKQSLSGLSFIKKKYTFNNHLLVPTIENHSSSKLKLERIHRTPLKEPCRNLQANPKMKESIREKKLDYKPLFKVKQIQRQRIPVLGVDAKRIKFPAACQKEQNELRKRRIKTEACTVERERPTGKAQFNSTYKFIGWQFEPQEDNPTMILRQ